MRREISTTPDQNKLMQVTLWGPLRGNSGTASDGATKGKTANSQHISRIWSPFQPAVLHPSTIITWEILFWPDVGWRWLRFPMGSLPEQTRFPPSFLAPTEKHPPITQLWDVVTATRIPGIFEFIGHIEWPRTDAPLGLPRLLIDGGPLRLELLVKQISQVLAAELIN